MQFFVDVVFRSCAPFSAVPYRGVWPPYFQLKFVYILHNSEKNHCKF